MKHDCAATSQMRKEDMRQPGAGVGRTPEVKPLQRCVEFEALRKRSCASIPNTVCSQVQGGEETIACQSAGNQCGTLVTYGTTNATQVCECVLLVCC